MRLLPRLQTAAFVLWASVLTVGCVDPVAEVTVNEVTVNEGIVVTARDAATPSWVWIAPVAVVAVLVILALLPWWLPRLHATVRAILFPESDRSEPPPA